MDANISLVGLVFLFYIYLPGNLVLVVGGKKHEEVSFHVAVFYGLWIFAIALMLLTAFKNNFLVGFLGSLVAMSKGNPVVDSSYVFWPFLTSYLLAVIFGFSVLLWKVGFGSSNFVREKLFRRKPDKSAKKFWVRKGDLPQDIFLAYRKEKKRPIIRAVMRDGREIEGECLRYSWDGEESILLKDFRHNDSLVWVKIPELQLLEFRNLTAIQQLEVSEENEREWRRRVLNGIVPGLGDEIFPPC